MSTTRILRSRATAKTKIPAPNQKVNNPGEKPVADMTTRSYRDVAASRSPSPSVEEKLAGVPLKTAETLKNNNDSSSESENDQDQGGPWIAIQRRHTRSLDSVDMSCNNKINVHFTPKKNKLSMEQLTTVKAAKSSMTEDQMEKVSHRQGAINAQVWRENNPVSGPSNNKGKTIDPLEWGNAGISEEELDIEAQKAALDAYNTYKEEHGKNKNESIDRKTKSKNRKCSKKRDENTSEADDNFMMPEVSRHKVVQSCTWQGHGTGHKEAACPME